MLDYNKPFFRTIVISISVIWFLFHPTDAAAQQEGDTTFLCPASFTTNYNNVTLNQLHNVSGFRGRKHTQQCVSQSSGGGLNMISFGLGDTTSTFVFGHRGTGYGREIWFDVNSNTANIDGTCVNGKPFTPGTPIELTAGQTHTIKFNTGATSWIGTIVVAADNTLSLPTGIELTAGTIPVNQCAASSSVVSTVKHTQKIISEFMLNRANNILANQPGMIGYLNGTNNEGGGPAGFLSLNGNEQGMDLAFSTSLSKLEREKEKSLSALVSGRSEETHRDEEAHTSSLASLFPAQRNSGSPTDSDTTIPKTSYGNEIDSGDRAYGADLGDGVEDISSYNAMPSRRYDIWTEIYGARSAAGDAESSLWVGYLGAHYFLTPNLIVGGMMQLDWASEENQTANSESDGHGWMAGPYVAGRFVGTSLFYEAKVLWGRSDNNVSPIGTYKDDFDTERFMASGKLKGTYIIDGLTISPALSVAYWEETQSSYTDSLTRTIPEQTITLGEVKFGPGFSKTLQLGNGAVFSPAFSIAGVWNFDAANNNASQANTLGDNGMRARVDAGFSFTNTLGWTLAANGYYDGLGIDDYEAMGGNVRLSIPLQ
ncbi:autotransporter outer membrane beta-barrel domain-containing protein [Salaquimonas pukyongi]|uniref:autotransporter outer membrane beta-barrel domain-containing protein n=1 Tax=Salaquimonas pukyongi TaxID=2712698 RepID=UPI0012EC4C05|nr:autotransporter outer membrane beta-barrel domain-containing protein [Salaquimonas pukyongi]